MLHKVQDAGGDDPNIPPLTNYSACSTTWWRSDGAAWSVDTNGCIVLTHCTTVGAVNEALMG